MSLRRYIDLAQSQANVVNVLTMLYHASSCPMQAAAAALTPEADSTPNERTADLLENHLSNLLSTITLKFGSNVAPM